MIYWITNFMVFKGINYLCIAEKSTSKIYCEATEDLEIKNSMPAGKNVDEIVRWHVVS